MTGPAGHVVRLSIAPVKALGLVHPPEVRFGRDGVAGDRRFLLVDAEGRMVNGKRVGPLVQVRPAWDEASGRLALTFPDGTVVDDEVRVGASSTTLMYGRATYGRVVEGPWADALSAFAGRRLVLLRLDRPGHGGDRGPTVSLVSAASLRRAAEAAGVDGALDGRRFRMLVELDGVPAHAEDAWYGGSVAVGDAVVRVAGHVGRCVVTGHDPDRGVTDLDTLGALRTYRDALPTTEPLALGVWGTVTTPGDVRVGDPVRPVDA